jgi:catalase
MTVLSQAGQFSAVGNSLPSFFKHDHQQISCFIHGSKIVNYHNAFAEDIPFIWQEIERNLT